MQQKYREQNISERRLFEKMLGADKQNLAAATVQKAATASVIINILYVMPTFWLKLGTRTPSALLKI